MTHYNKTKLSVTKQDLLLQEGRFESQSMELSSSTLHVLKGDPSRS